MACYLTISLTASDQFFIHSYFGTIQTHFKYETHSFILQFDLSLVITDDNYIFLNQKNN